MERTRTDNKNKKTVWRLEKQEGKVTIGFSFASDLSKLSDKSKREVDQNLCDHALLSIYY